MFTFIHQMEISYLIAPCRLGCLALYESDDYRLRKIHPSARRYGTFHETFEVRGEYNGHELGIFTSEDTCEEYLVFTDYTVKLR